MIRPERPSGGDAISRLTRQAFALGLLSAALASTPLGAQLASPDERGVAFGHVHLYVASVEEHARAWVDLFDVEVVERAEYTALRIPGALIFLTEQTPTLPSEATVADRIGLAVRDLDAVVETARSLGYAPMMAREGSSTTAQVTLPDGVKLELRESPTRSGSVGMDHVRLVVPAPGELGAWYARILDRPGAEGGAVDAPGGSLRFSAAEEDRAPTSGTAIEHFGFEVTDIQAFASHLRREGVVFDTEPFHVESLDLWVAFFTDPSGARVEITQGLDHF